MLIAVIAAILLCLINVSIAIIVINRAFKKDPKESTKIVLASMVIRFFSMIILIWVGVELLNLHAFAFSLTLLISSFILLIAEILYVHFHRFS